MGQIVSAANLTGVTINGILLGDPAQDEHGNYVWDDDRIPDINVVVTPEIAQAVEVAP